MSAAAGVGLVGAGMSLASTFFGKGDKVTVPEFTPVDITKSQEQAIAGNLANAPAAEKLAGRTNTFNQEQILNMLRAAIPGYDEIQKQTGAQIQSMLRGEIPADVSNQVWDSATARGLGKGFGEGGIGRNLKARDLGLTSLEITQRGLDSASKWIAQTRATATPELMTSASMFLTPAQRVGIDVEQNKMAWSAALQKNVEAAKPDPHEAALSDWLNQTGQMLEGAGVMGAMSGGGGLTSRPWTYQDWNAWNTNRSLDRMGYGW